MSDIESDESDYDVTYEEVVAPINSDDENEIEDNDAENDSEDYSDEDIPTVVKTQHEDDTHIKNMIPIDKQITSRRLTLAECTQAVGRRAAMIDAGCPIFVDISNLNNSRSIALKELYEKKFPLCIDRHVDSDKVERIPINIMLLPPRFAENNPY